ncbi:5-histidylcysteine sulfoxide synthase [Geminocystis sp.]|uniref:5-histidylcysteine sulfoxide synthase n=1 Tax=Geminocystis sp. TaxID=2664100 RepID=UPI00359371E5
MLTLNDCNKQDIINYLTNSWETEDLLFKSIINSETFYLNPDSLRNPLIFYLGHSAVFYINKLVILRLLKESQRINPDYEKLYEIGVDPETPNELQKAIAFIKWAKVEELWQYRHQAYKMVINVIEKTPLTLPITPDSLWWGIIMSIEHQRIHIETSSMLIRQLPLELVRKPSQWHYAKSQGKPPTNEMIKIKGGKVILGKKKDDNLYGWDVDFGEKEVIISPFQVSKYLITNGEFLEFVNNKGYDNKNYWDEISWQWKLENKASYPKFWRKLSHNYSYRLMFDEIDLPLDFPVEVNHHEANAYCRYLSQKLGNKYQLMSEAQWQFLQQKSDDNINNYNLNFKFISPHSVGSLETSKNDQNIYDLRGNVWEWLGDIFTPLSSFKPHYLYQDYSAPFFDNRHYMLMGGSWATNGYEATPYYRNWFRPYFYQHAGFRIILSDNSH